MYTTSYKLLYKIYELTLGDTDKPVPLEKLFDFGDALGFNKELTHNSINDLMRSGCIKIETIGGPFFITHLGVHEAKKT
jgi:hypothetical protein